MLCSDVDAVPLSRAAAASSAVPLVLSAGTINNYGGTCGYRMPFDLSQLSAAGSLPRPAARVAQRLRELQSFEQSRLRPYLHLVDGGISDNLGLRAVVDIVLGLEALRALNQKTALDDLHRIVVFIVNSLSSPETNWDESESPPGIFETLVKSTGVPIDRNSYETVELLKDIAARWSTLRRIRGSPAFVVENDRSLQEIVSGPDIELFLIDVSLAALDDKAEFDYLNNLSTALALPDEAIDRLRAAAQRIIVNSPDFGGCSRNWRTPSRNSATPQTEWP